MNVQRELDYVLQDPEGSSKELTKLLQANNLHWMEKARLGQQATPEVLTREQKVQLGNTIVGLCEQGKIKVDQIGLVSRFALMLLENNINEVDNVKIIKHAVNLMYSNMQNILIYAGLLYHTLQAQLKILPRW